MFRARITMVCMFATTLGVSVGCSAQTPKAIAQNLHNALDQSYASHDLNRMLGFYDSSFVGTDAQGKREALADLRKRLERTFTGTRWRSMTPRTTVEDVRLEGYRMVVTYKSEMRFEARNQLYEWEPAISKESGKEIWLWKSSRWKLVQGTVFRVDTQYDPKYREKSGQRVSKAVEANPVEAKEQEEQTAGHDGTLRASECCDSRPAQTPKAIAQRLCDQFDQAWANHDLKQYLNFVDSSYVWTDAQGKRHAYAEWRRTLEHEFPLYRRQRASITVEDVQLGADRMSFHWNNESHFEYYVRDYGWLRASSQGSGESTWEKKGGQWKFVRETDEQANLEVDPQDQQAFETWKHERIEWDKTVDRISCMAGVLGTTNPSACY